MKCENELTKCQKEADEQVERYKTLFLPTLLRNLCHFHALTWATVLKKQGMRFDRRPLGEVNHGDDR